MYKRQALVESEEVASLTEFMTSFIEEHKAILIKLINERESFEVQLLGGLERLVAGKFYEEKQLLPKAIIQLYNLDIVSEETILSFYTKCSGRFIEKKKSKELRRLAKPVIEWLQQAEEDSDEE